MRERERKREAEIERDRQTETETDRDGLRKIGRNKNREANGINTGKPTKRNLQREMERQRTWHRASVCS